MTVTVEAATEEAPAEVADPKPGKWCILYCPINHWMIWSEGDPKEPPDTYRQEFTYREAAGIARRLKRETRNKERQEVGEIKLVRLA